MKKVGILCEYNPFHLGHQKQLCRIRQEFGGECGIVCLMSGFFVQRGEPAVFDPGLRAKAAILSGADLVLELPVTRSLSSAEGFAGGGVEILSQFCDTMCFGTETGDAHSLMATAEALLSPAFPEKLKEALTPGCSFPAARQRALEQMGMDAALLSRPNDLLAVEYCKAIVSQKAQLLPFPIIRQGSYHAEIPDAENPSATALRKCILENRSWLSYVPEPARDCFRDAPVHSLAAGERAVLARLRTMSDADFEALPFGSEGLWRKLMHSARSCASLDDILSNTKSKRYTMTRLNRMVICGFLGLTQKDLERPIPYVRILAFNSRGREILNENKKRIPLLNAGASSPHPFGRIEERCGSLYGLFQQYCPGNPMAASAQRIFYHSK